MATEWRATKINQRWLSELDKKKVCVLTSWFRLVQCADQSLGSVPTFYRTILTSFESFAHSLCVFHVRYENAVLFYCDKMFQKLRNYLQKLSGFQSDARLRRANDVWQMVLATKRSLPDPRVRCTTEHRPAARAPTLDHNITGGVPFSVYFAILLNYRQNKKH